MNKINPKEAFRLYQLTKFYPLCILSNLFSIMVPGLIIVFWINRTFSITVQRKGKLMALTESELLLLLDKIQEKKRMDI